MLRDENNPGKFRENCASVDCSEVGIVFLLRRRGTKYTQLIPINDCLR